MRLFFIVCATLVLCISTCSASDYADFKDLAADFDAKTHLEMGGANGERFITFGLDYDRVQKVSEKLGNSLPVFLVADDSFNAAASTSCIYVNTGALKRCPSDDLLAPILAYELAHISQHHLEKQYDKMVENARQIDNAVQAVNKPGYEENARLAVKIGKVIMSLTSLHYSREDVEEADLQSFISVKTAGYNVEEGLGIYDIMSKAPKGVLGNFFTHSAPDVRKAKVIEGLKKSEVSEQSLDAVYDAARKIKAVDSADFAKMVRAQKFPGYAYRLISKSNCLYLLCKGEGQLSSKHKKFSLASLKAAITLPAETKEVYLVAVNPIPANYMGHLMIMVNPNSSGFGEELYKLYTTDLHLDNMAMRIPIKVLQRGQEFGFSVVLSKKPVPEGTKPGDDSNNLFDRTCIVTFDY